MVPRFRDVCNDGALDADAKLSSLAALMDASHASCRLTSRECGGTTATAMQPSVRSRFVISDVRPHDCLIVFLAPSWLPSSPLISRNLHDGLP